MSRRPGLEVLQQPSPRFQHPAPRLDAAARRHLRRPRRPLRPRAACGAPPPRASAGAHLSLLEAAVEEGVARDPVRRDSQRRHFAKYRHGAWQLPRFRATVEQSGVPAAKRGARALAGDGSARHHAWRRRGTRRRARDSVTHRARDAPGARRAARPFVPRVAFGSSEQFGIVWNSSEGSRVAGRGEFQTRDFKWGFTLLINSITRFHRSSYQGQLM